MFHDHGEYGCAHAWIGSGRRSGICVASLRPESVVWRKVQAEDVPSVIPVLSRTGRAKPKSACERPPTYQEISRPRAGEARAGLDPGNVCGGIITMIVTLD